MGTPRILVYGRNSADIQSVIDELELETVNVNPDIVVSYGGDGTLLSAEREYPGIPKVALRDSKRCNTCSHHSNEELLRHLADNTLRRVEFIKLLAEAGDNELVCLNNVILHNASIAEGLRYRVWIDEESYGEDEIVGDGLVVSTPFGSAAYYRSITRSTFRVGMGLAFNNSIEPINHLVLSDQSVIRVLITRGPATVVGDQEPGSFSMQQGEELIIRQAAEKATLLVYDHVRYPADQFIYFNENEQLRYKSEK
ncbi:MAG: hypothetical protein ACOC29_00125 [Candidatus Sumerlaeota bacterium]